ncbi:FecR domain-containing protein [Candidatus Woesearchaeota archaeon]|nr:FecR domain-containing protein [Candidatus Woesearchaeota archaeon]
MRNINCSYIKEKISAYLDGELGAGDKEAVQGHLERCLSCRESFLRISKVKETLAYLKEQDFNFPGAPASILENINLRIPKHSFGIFSDPVARNIIIGFSIVLIFFAGWINLPPEFLGAPPAGTLTAYTRGQAVIYQDTQWQQLGHYCRLKSGSRLGTEENSSLRILFPDKNGTLLVKASSLLEIRRIKPELAFALSKGEALVSVAKGNNLNIYTPGARVQVWGTKFKVFTDDNKTEVEVLEGAVRVWGLLKEELLGEARQFEKITVTNEQSIVNTLLPEEIKLLSDEFTQAGAHKEKTGTLLGPGLWREVK